MRAWLRRLVDILSTLECHSEKGYVSGQNANFPLESTQLKTAIRLLKESAKSCRESWWFLQAGVRCFGRYLRSLANLLVQKLPFRGHISAVRQSQEQISHQLQDSHSCPQSDAKKKEASSDEKSRGAT